MQVPVSPWGQGPHVIPYPLAGTMHKNRAWRKAGVRAVFMDRATVTENTELLAWGWLLRNSPRWIPAER